MKIQCIWFLYVSWRRILKLSCKIKSSMINIPLENHLNYTVYITISILQALIKASKVRS